MNQLTTIFMSKDGLKNYPLNRYVLQRDGNGNVIEIVTKELISRKLVPGLVTKDSEQKPNSASAGGGLNGKFNQTTDEDSDVEVYTHVKFDKAG